MTKEELKDIICDSDYEYEKFDEFFSQNVVIPKGENRHPYSDVLHEWIEGRVEGVFKYPYGSHRGIAKHIFTEYSDFKIEEFKPLKPVYEWQYAVVTSVSGSARLEWLTPIEAVAKYGNNAYAIDETKRERK